MRSPAAIIFLLGLAFTALPLAAADTAWHGYGGNAQHTALSNVPAQPLDKILWQTPVDLLPQYQGSDLFIHYGEPMATASNTLIVPVKTGATDGFQISAFSGASGASKWTLQTDYTLPPHANVWTPSFPAALTPQNRLYFAGAGGTVYYVDNPDADGAAASGQFAFVGLANYQANKISCDAHVFISSPLTSDAAGNIYFCFIATAGSPLLLSSGIARVAPDGGAAYISAQAAAGCDASITKPVYNCAPALSNDGAKLYVAVSDTTGLFGHGRLVVLNASTLAYINSVVLQDPSGSLSNLPDDGTASPLVGPDGDVYFGVLENPFPSNNDRGWLLHFSADLATQKNTGAFGWDDTPSIVPAAMVHSYTGASAYLLAAKYNNYAGIGSGDGVNKLAILDPNATETDPISTRTVMKEVLTITAVTPDADHVASFPNAVREWCINSAVVDPATGSIYAGSEDGKLYRWDLAANTFTGIITLTSGIGEAYTPTLIGPDGTVYAINNATLFAVGAVSIGITPAVLAAATVGVEFSAQLSASGGTAPYSFAVTAGVLPPGLALSGAGVLSGMPTTEGSYSFTVTATDSSAETGPFTGSAALSIAVDHVPSFLSGPTANPNPAVVKLAVAFIASTDLADAVIAWNFGDGAPAATGAGVQHIYTAEDTYTITATATNPRTHSAASATLTLPVGHDSFLPGTLPTLLTKGAIKLGAPSGDQVAVTSYFPLQPNQKVQGLALNFSIGSLAYSLSFDSRGNAAVPNGRAHLRIIRSKSQGLTGRLDIKLRGQLKAALAAGTTLNAQGLPEKALVEIGNNGTTYSAIAALVFKKSIARF